jgi:hypothetical protein
MQDINSTYRKKERIGESRDWSKLGVQLMTDILVTIQVAILMHVISVV